MKELTKENFLLMFENDRKFSINNIELIGKYAHDFRAYFSVKVNETIYNNIEVKAYDRYLKCNCTRDQNYILSIFLFYNDKKLFKEITTTSKIGFNDLYKLCN